jgi:uncharacterized protein DUF4154
MILSYSRLPKIKWACGASLLAMCFFFAPSTKAESEYDVKAAFLFKFTKFVEWPSAAFPSADAPFVIGIVGRDPFGGLDRILEGKRTGDRNFEVRNLSATDSAKLRACQMIFVNASEKHHLDDILSAVQGRPVLVAGETEGFASGGGMVGFVVRRSHMGLEVNSSAAGAARLKISSQLLNIARIVN